MKKSAFITILVAAMLIVPISYAIVTLTHQQSMDPSSDVTMDEGIHETLLLNASVYDQMTHFSLQLYTTLYEAQKNGFISPYSIFTALGMTAEGANGSTAEEMAKVLGYQKRNESALMAIQTLYEQLNQQSSYTIHTANALWVRQQQMLLETYSSLIETYYKGSIEPIDFTNPTAAADSINSWVAEQTNETIKDLISSGAIDPILTYLILTNAIYFKGDWAWQFDEQNTTDQVFYRSADDMITVPMMQLIQAEETFSYTETDTMQILELPYDGNNLSMLLFLPKNQQNIESFLSDMTVESLHTIRQNLRKQLVHIYLPRFKLKTSYSLNNPLQQMGIQEAFSPDASFPYMFEEEISGLHIDSVIHKAFIEVNEKGTEAAAATAVIINTVSIDPDLPTIPVFRADHPFMFLIQHKPTGIPLFMGNVYDPLVEE